MKERPILFSAPMVKALLAGSKTQTRRLVKPQPTGVLGPLPPDSKRAGKWWFSGGPAPFASFERACPYGVPGDTLWVREAHYLTDDGDSEYAVYAAEARSVEKHLRECREMAARHPVGDGWFKRHTKLRPSIHMPRWASRITLRVTDVRVERLNAISEADALAEGVIWSERWNGFVVPGVEHPNKDFPVLSRATAREQYAALWDVINGSGEWLANPWVWAVSFEVMK